ncbi:hypothetical protein AB0C77_10080 [Streptomyces sp. NPDC048629]|uniref:hypothetical protein n=1 Tax=Streptomyces sp. NPDC048629 TaxID=3154824 RepID=UPI00342534E6
MRLRRLRRRQREGRELACLDRRLDRRDRPLPHQPYVPLRLRLRSRLTGRLTGPLYGSGLRRRAGLLWERHPHDRLLRHEGPHLGLGSGLGRLPDLSPQNHRRLARRDRLRLPLDVDDIR